MSAELTQIRANIQKCLDNLTGSPCTFWACQGPDAGLVPMQTCNVCDTIITLRKIRDSAIQLAINPAPTVVASTTAPPPGG